MSENKNLKPITHPLNKTVPEDLQSYIENLSLELTKEYNCINALERSLCEIIANSYWRIISVSKLMQDDLSLNSPSKYKFRYLEILSKELDRENKNYLAALNNLIEIKTPNTTINLNSDNLFLSQNQQFNNNQDKLWKD